MDNKQNFGSEIKPTDIKPTDIKPTDIHPTDIKPTDIKPTDIKPTDIKPTDIKPTDIKPTEINPTDIKPTEINPTDIKNKFNLKMLTRYAITSIIGFLALLFNMNNNSSSISWLLDCFFLFFGISGILQIFKEINKLPFSQEIINAYNSSLKQGQIGINPNKVNKIQKIKAQIKNTDKKTQTTILTSLVLAAVIGVLSLGNGLVTLAGGANIGANTTITGTWEHELGSVQGENDWVTTTTMWNVESSEGGYLYMNVNEDSSFTLTYNNAQVSSGTWEERDDGYYYFIYNDSDDILISVSYEYKIKGSKLYPTYGADAYFTKA